MWVFLPNAVIQGSNEIVFKVIIIIFVGPKRKLKLRMKLISQACRLLPMIISINNLISLLLIIIGKYNII